MTAIPALPPLDLGIAVAYVLAVILVGLRLTRRDADPADFFLAARHARWPTIGLSLVASNISPTALIGITGSAYALGVSVYNYEWLAAVVLAGFAIVYLPAVLSSQAYTMPEFLERRYDGRIRLWFAVLTLVLNLLLDAAGTLYGGALLLQLAVPALSLQVAVLLLSIIAGVYAVTGGLRAVMYTEAAQAIVIITASLILAFLSFRAAGGLLEVIAFAPPEKLSLIRPASDPVMPWTGLLFGAPILGFYFWCNNQFMVQRMLAARSLTDGQKGALLAGALKLLSLVTFVLPGIAALKLYPGLSQSDQAYPSLVFGLLPTGLLGILLAGFFGAMLAQLSATFNSAATIITLDIMRGRTRMDDQAMVRVGRIATIASMVVAALWSPQIARFPSLWQYLQSILSYATPPVVALFAIGMLWRGANSRGAMSAVVVGSLVGAAFLALNVSGTFPVQFLHVAAIVFVTSATALVVGSLYRRSVSAIADASGIGQTIRGFSIDATPGVLWSAAGLMAATAAIVIAFR